jgi:putative ABC transport system ATP-binding protein
MNPSKILIETEKITKTFGSKEVMVQAIKDISVKIPEGQFIAILGKSGSGKSTFMSLLAGLEHPTSGTVRFDGNTINQRSEDELSLFRRNHIGIVFQHFNLIPTMTALENVELPLLINGIASKIRKEKALDLLNRVGLKNKIQHLPEELSGGEKQRVGIARALVGRPSVILADEPTGDLDSETGDKIIDMLMEINKGPDWKPVILMVTHDELKLRKGMRILRMKDGMIVKDELFQDKKELSHS